MSVRSKRYRLDLRDFFKGLAMAVSTSVIAVLLESYNLGDFVLNWNTIKGAALVGGLGYIKLCFFSNNHGELMKENKE